jgi:hypothetical protein
VSEWEWPSLTEILPESENDGARIAYIDISPEDSKRSAMRGGLEYVKAGRYVQLFVKGEGLVMSDTRMERFSNISVVSDATGDVLIAGLGLGLIVIPICLKDRVRSVTVIEKSQAVIDLVEPRLRKHLGDSASKLTVICEDIFEWKPPKGQKWETIWFDIWPTICGDALPEIARLKQRFKMRVRRNGDGWFFRAWMEEHLRAERRREQNNPWRW